jgi:5-methylcytosine-specific restriction endonuclease McrA
MPIRPELRKFYGRAWREEIRPRILARDDHRCRRCGIANYTRVRNRRGLLTRVVLTVGHLNHVAGDDRDENLAALCQRCHLLYDAAHHRDSRSARKDSARPLLATGGQDARL